MAVVDASGVVQDSYTYDVYGTPTRTGSLANEFDFAGQQTDGTGLQYLRARYMDPATGAFLSREPLAVGPRWLGNPTGYAHSSPTRFADPSGLFLVELEPGGSNGCHNIQCGTITEPPGSGASINWSGSVDASKYVGRPTAWVAGVLNVMQEFDPFWKRMYVLAAIDAAVDLALNGDVDGAILTLATIGLGPEFIVPIILVGTLVDDFINPTPAGDPCDYDAVHEVCRVGTPLDEYQEGTGS